jgi:hypothetical protein
MTQSIISPDTEIFSVISFIVDSDGTGIIYGASGITIAARIYKFIQLIQKRSSGKSYCNGICKDGMVRNIVSEMNRRHIGVYIDRVGRDEKSGVITNIFCICTDIFSIAAGGGDKQGSSIIIQCNSSCTSGSASDESVSIMRSIGISDADEIVGDRSDFYGIREIQICEGKSCSRKRCRDIVS